MTNTHDGGPAFPATDLICELRARAALSQNPRFVRAMLGAAEHLEYAMAVEGIRARAAQSPAETQAAHLREFGK